MTGATFLSGVRMTLDTIREHKLRASLTVLGVIIGTGAVIGVGSILAGWRHHKYFSQLRSHDPDRIQIQNRRARRRPDARRDAPQTIDI